jgi:phosphatidylinositol glycan class B
MNKKTAVYYFFIVLIFVVTALYSHGYYQADEHYQLIEFAHAFVVDDFSGLPWEYASKIRPTLQVFPVIGLEKLFHFSGIDNPYALSTTLRLITGLFLFFAIHYCYKRLNSLSQLKNSWLNYLSYLLWFIPFLAIRYSSETWSGGVLLLLVGYLLDDRKQFNRTKGLVVIGFLFSLSFAIRFQSAFFIIAIILWLFVVQKIKLKKIGVLLFSSFVFFILFSLLDVLYYNEVVLTPFNYFYSNIVDKVAASFGVYPWHYYIEYTVVHSSLPIGIGVLVSMIYVLIKSPKDLVLWVCLSYTIGHSLVGHKEIRFLFTIAFFVPYFLQIGLRDLSLNYRKIYLPVIFSFFLINSLLLGVMSIKPAGTGAMAITKFLYDEVKKPTIMYYKSVNTYSEWGINTPFYENELVEVVNLENEKLLEPQSYVVLNYKEKNSPIMMAFIRSQHLVLVKQSVADGVIVLARKTYRPFNDNGVFFLYKKE